MPEQYKVGEIKKIYDSVLTKYEQDPSDPLVSLYAQKHDLSVDDLGAGAAARRALAKNPEDKGALAVNNDLFQKISDKLPAENLGFFDVGGGYRSEKGGIIPYAKALTARTLVNNTISSNPDLQAQYFSRKGYISRVIGDRVEIRRPDEIGFRPIEKDGIDLFDATDIVDDVLQGVAEGAKISAKTAGAATGVGIPIAMGVAGATGAAFETGRQAAGKILGTRDDYDFPQIMKEGLISATFPGAQVAVGAGLKAGATGVTKLTGLLERYKPNEAQIRAAAKDLGLELLPGQISSSKLVQELTEAQYRAAGLLGPYAIKAKKVINDTYDKIESELRGLVGPRSGDKPYASGQKFMDSVETLIDARKDAAQTWYQSATDANFFKNANVNTTNLSANLAALKDKYQGSGSSLDMIAKYENMLDGVNRMHGLNRLKSEVLDEIRMKKGAVSGSELETIRDIKDLIKDSYDENFDMFLQNAKSGKWKTKPEDIIAAKTSKDIADRLWRDLYEDLATIVARPGKEVRGGPEAVLEKFMIQNQPEKFIDKVFSSNDMKKITEIAKRFPEAFETLRQGKLQQLYDKWAPGDAFNKTVAINELKKMKDDKLKNIIFGKDADKKIENLIVIYDSIPKEMNPSQTAKALQIINGEWFKANTASLIRGTLLSLSRTSADLGQGLLLNLGKTLEGKRALQAAGIGKQGVRQLLPSEKGPESEYILLPDMQNNNK
jgi:hypothetical protein